MIQKLKSMKANQKGFTLAELLIVVAIIAVLAAIAFPVFAKQLDKAKESVDLANAAAIEHMAVADAMLEHKAGTYYGVISNTKGQGQEIEVEKTTTPPSTGYNQAKQGTSKTIAAEGGVYKVVVDEDYKITSATWESKGS